MLEQLQGGLRVARGDEFLDDAVTVEVTSPFGPPSDPLVVGEVAGRRVAFLPRHGVDHRWPPLTVTILGLALALAQLFEPAPGRVAIIPNYRMIDKGEAGSGPAYRALLAGTAKHLLARGYRPFLLVHDSGSDRELAGEVSAAAGGGVEVLHEPDPRALKGILGSCHAVVASRFHALVGALTQGVPSLATGWSHKYEELFAEFASEPLAASIDAAPLPLISHRVTMNGVEEL